MSGSVYRSIGRFLLGHRTFGRQTWAFLSSGRIAYAIMIMKLVPHRGHSSGSIQTSPIRARNILGLAHIPEVTWGRPEGATSLQCKV